MIVWIPLPVAQFKPPKRQNCRMQHTPTINCFGDALAVKKIAATPENRLDDSARFWTAAVLCRFSTGMRVTQSGRKLPQSTTLTRNAFARDRPWWPQFF
jgi:hypothetical protein